MFIFLGLLLIVLAIIGLVVTVIATCEKLWAWAAVALVTGCLSMLLGIACISKANTLNRENGDREAVRCEKLGGTPTWDEHLNYSECKGLN